MAEPGVITLTFDFRPLVAAFAQVAENLNEALRTIAAFLTAAESPEPLYEPPPSWAVGIEMNGYGL